MPKKKGANEGKGGDTEGSGKKNKDVDMGTEFYDCVASAMQNNMDDLKAFHASFSERWKKFSMAANGIISEGLSKNNEKQKELYDIYKKYLAALEEKRQSIHEKETQAYEEMLATWQEAGSKLRSLFNIRDSEGGHPDYLMWVEYANSMTRQINKSVTECFKEYGEMARMWFEFLDRMKEEISFLGMADSGLSNKVKKVQEILTNMGTDVSNYVSMCSRSAAGLQKSWVNMMISARNACFKIMSDNIYRDLYLDFIEGNSWNPQTSRVSSTKVEKLEEEVRELKAKIKELEVKSQKA